MKRLLFVDDEKNVLDGVRRMLHAHRDRWEMHFAASGNDALLLCRAHRFDAVISDMRMPGMDGATLLGHVRDLAPEAARLVLSGYSEAVLATRAVSVAHRVLTKPCNSAELQQTLDRVFTLQDLFASPELRGAVGTIGALPSLSSTYNTLSQALADPGVSLAGVSEIIEGDVAITAKILQLVNSGFFGLAQTKTNLQSAVTYLGITTIRNLALASDTFRVFTPTSAATGTFCETLQRHAHATAAIAGALPTRPGERETAVTAALLHDIGHLVLACQLPERLAAAESLAKERGCPLFEAEEALLGTSHAEIGAYLLGLWGIDTVTVEAVAHHHRPARIPHAALDSSLAVYLADLIAHQLEEHPDASDGECIGEAHRQYLTSVDLWSSFPAFVAAGRCAVN